ncbi:hypothetical protein yberc0001_26490 [Yersinia bercovieri ATCC 43970]|uniref:Uncharacterized protein n=1 Tax=Yersinia bercovieri ATCC 43970 TaxID=349968 RepID=A0ABM9XXN1_YERBE|nr:hypothetical protein yberc0001_26490 [Yersinia bercovieri ATCC 43970]
MILVNCTVDRGWAIVTPQRKNLLPGLEPRISTGRITA